MKKTKAKQIVKEQIKSLYEKDLNAKKKPRPDAEDEANDELDATGVVDEPMGGGNVEDIQKNLQDAFNASKGLGDDKLAQQIANTITYFTRSHVLKAGVTEENESLRRMQELAGIEEDEVIDETIEEDENQQPSITMKFWLSGNMDKTTYHDMVSRILIEDELEAFNEMSGQTDRIELI